MQTWRMQSLQNGKYITSLNATPLQEYYRATTMRTITLDCIQFWTCSRTHRHTDAQADNAQHSTLLYQGRRIHTSLIRVIFPNEKCKFSLKLENLCDLSLLKWCTHVLNWLWYRYALKHCLCMLREIIKKTEDGRYLVCILHPLKSLYILMRCLYVVRHARQTLPASGWWLRQSVRQRSVDNSVCREVGVGFRLIDDTTSLRIDCSLHGVSQSDRSMSAALWICDAVPMMSNCDNSSIGLPFSFI